MTWTNWTTYLNSVLDFFLGLFPTFLNLIMSNPLLGVPVIISIVGLCLGLVVQFLGVFKPSGKSEK